MCSVGVFMNQCDYTIAEKFVGKSKEVKAACLVLAPHLSYPTRNGADILIDRRWAEFSHHVAYVDILGSNVLVRYQCGVCISVQEYSNRARSKLWSSLRTVVQCSHYLLEKLITRNFAHMAGECLSKPVYGMVVCSYISTASLAVHGMNPDRVYCVETHNDEIKWFTDMRHSTRNPLVKIVAWMSENWLLRFLRRHETDFLYLHVAKTDQAHYLALFPRQISYVSPVGCDLDERLSIHADLAVGRPVRLLFVGSLSVKMNYDAIKNFAERYYPVIRQGLAGQLDVQIVGSNPSDQVEQLCAQMSWGLCANVSDEELVEAYDWADFSILPFAYATGGKLKLFKSLSQAVPFLATEAVSGQLDEIDRTCLVSDQPSEWLQHIIKIREAGITQEQRKQLVVCAQKYSWSKIASDLYQRLTFPRKIVFQG